MNPKNLPNYESKVCSCEMRKTFITQVKFIWPYMCIKFILVKNNSSHFAYLNYMAAEYFRTRLIIIIGLLECLSNLRICMYTQKRSLKEISSFAL